MNDSSTIIKTPPPSVGKLDTVQRVREELSRLYRAARRHLGNEVDPQSASKLAYLLNSIGKSIEAAELENRINNLEAKLHELKKTQ